MPISSELFSALEKGGGLAVEKTPPADKPAPQGGGSTFDRLLRQESGGRQTDKNGNVITSSKGAIGIAQVMPATGPEAAKLAGMEWDPVRFKSDAEYNKALGRAYFDKQLSVFGDERLALAAYNAGPGAVRLAIARSAKNGGDPLEYLPLETQKYVPAILGADAGVKPKGPKWADDKAIVRDDGRPGAIAKSDAVRAGPTAGDMAKAFGASALSGVGDMGQGLIGEPLAWLANKAAGTEEFEGQNLLAGVAESIRDDMTEGGKIARQDVPSGDVFQPETWKLPETTGGMLMIGADGLGSLVPSILPFVGQAGKAANLAKAAQAAKVAGDFEKASQLAIQAERASRVAKGAGAVGGFAMTGGAAAGEVRQNTERELQGKSHEELLQNVPLYREAFDKTGDARMARQAVANGAAQYATLFAGAMGAVGGGINAKLLEDVIVKRGLSAALGKMSGNAAVRAGVGAGAGAVGEGLQEVSEKMGQNAGENVGMGRPIADNVTRDSFGDFVGGAMVGGPMGGMGGGASLNVNQPASQPAVQPTIQPNSPLSNMASIGQAAQANAAQEQAAAGVAPPEVQADPTADRLAAMQSFVEDKAFIQALRGTEGYGPESVTELLSAYAKARNPNIDPRLRERALSDLEKFVETFNNRPNFVFGKNTQEPTPQPGQSVAPYQQQGGAVGPTIRRPDGRTLDGEIITRPEGMAGANPNQLKAPPVLGLPTKEALQAKRQADADYEQAYQDLVKAEQLGANEAEIADYQRAMLEAERLRDELAAQLADSDARVADSQQREAEARRRDILGSVIEQGISGVNPVADVAGRFSAELMRQGYRDTAPTDAETQSILRAVDVANAREDGPLPSLPNEGNFYAPPKAQRTAPPKAEPKPKQQPNRRLTPKEIREYVAAGAALNGDTLTLPDGTVLKLKGPQIAAAREAMRKIEKVSEEVAPTEEVGEKASPQEATPQQVESPAAVSASPAETPGVSTRTDDQLRYLASNGKPGWKEAAQAEMARREGAKPEIRSDLDAAAHEAATSPLNDTPQPTDGQKSAGNYKVGRVRVQGMDISIENPKGSVRSGTSPDGRKWESTLHAHYGYFTGTKAADGDHLDVYLTDGAEDAPMVWVIDQKNADGTFDEHKTLLGPRAEEEAKAAYLANYEPGWDGIGAISSMPIEAFKAWAFDGKKKRKPLVYVEPEAPATEASDTATAQPDPREAYADQKAEAYIAQRGGNAPPKAVEAVRIGARKEFDKGQDKQSKWISLDEYVKSHPNVRETRARSAWASDISDAITEGKDIPPTIVDELLEKMPGFAPDAIASRDVLMDRYKQAIDTDIERAIERLREEHANLAKKLDHKRVKTSHEKYVEVRDQLISLNDRIHALEQERSDRARGDFTTETAAEDYLVRRLVQLSGVSEEDAKTRIVRATVSAQPTHQDPGQPSEPVTPAVVAKSIQKSARNTEFNPADAKKWLLGEIDKAVANVPAENAELAAELAREKAKTFDMQAAERKYGKGSKAASSARDSFNALRDSNVAKIAKQIGFVTFDVPGDGKFKVLNTVDGLNAFRSKVEKSPGFKTPAIKPPTMRSETNTGSYGPRDAILEGDYLNAYELAKLQDKPMVFSVGTNNQKPTAYTDTSTADGIIDGIAFVVGREATKDGKWFVIEPATGILLNKNGLPSKVAALTASKAITKGKEDGLRRVIADPSKAMPQSTLEAEWLAWAEKEEGVTLKAPAEDAPPKDPTPKEPVEQEESVSSEPSSQVAESVADDEPDLDPTETAIPGVSEILRLSKSVRNDGARYASQFSRMMEDEGNDGARPPKLTGDGSEKRLDEMLAANPRAAQYVRALAFEDASNYMKAAAGTKAKNMLLAGESAEKAKAALDDWTGEKAKLEESKPNDARLREIMTRENGWDVVENMPEFFSPEWRGLQDQGYKMYMLGRDGNPIENTLNGSVMAKPLPADSENADARKAARSNVGQPSDLTNIFAGLSSRGLAKTRAQKAAQAHPRAEQIAYVQDNFLDILTELEDSGIVNINCD